MGALLLNATDLVGKYAECAAGKQAWIDWYNNGLQQENK